MIMLECDTSLMVSNVCGADKVWLLPPAVTTKGPAVPARCSALLYGSKHPSFDVSHDPCCCPDISLLSALLKAQMLDTLRMH